MESLKLKVKHRHTLFCGKYKYRLKIESPLLKYVYSIEDVVDDTIIRYFREVGFKLYISYKEGRVLEDDEIELKFFDLENFNWLKEVLLSISNTEYNIRFNYNNNVSIFSNNLKLLKRIGKKFKSNILEEAQTFPTGVMQFKNDPPANFRIYTTSKKLDSAEKKELLRTIKKTKGMSASKSFYEYINNTIFQHVWLQNNFYLDIMDNSNITFLQLKFPNLIRKVYKLEKIA